MHIERLIRPRLSTAACQTGGGYDSETSLMTTQGEGYRPRRYNTPFCQEYDCLAEGVLAVSSEDVDWNEGEFEF